MRCNATETQGGERVALGHWAWKKHRRWLQKRPQRALVGLPHPVVGKHTLNF